MKLQYKPILFLISTIIVLILVQCEEDQNEWGFALISMPQASVYDGASTNNYPVPLDNNPAIQNYVLDTVANTIDIYLGVYRSGLQPLAACSVDIFTKQDTVNQLIAGEVISNAAMLPADVYTLPQTVFISDGERETFFKLTVNLQKLIDEYSQLGGQNLVLAVSLDNPSKYELNKALSTTIVIIDSRHFMPAPPIVNMILGGDMEAESEQYWMWTGGDQEWGYSDDIPESGIGGCLKWFNETSTDVNGHIYHEVQLEEGEQYELSAKVKVPEDAVSFWLDFNLTDILPGNSNWDATGDFIGIWAPEATDLLDGDIREVGNVGWGDYGNGLASGTNGVFTATSSTMYVFIKLGVCCGGTFNGAVLIDEVRLVKVD